MTFASTICIRILRRKTGHCYFEKSFKPPSILKRYRQLEGKRLFVLFIFNVLCHKTTTQQASAAPRKL
jgi:hypothetical protein